MEVIVVLGEVVEGHLHRHRLLVDPLPDVVLQDLALEKADPADRAANEDLQQHDAGEQARRFHEWGGGRHAGAAGNRGEQGVDDALGEVDGGGGEQALDEEQCRATTRSTGRLPPRRGESSRARNEPLQVFASRSALTSISFS